MSITAISDKEEMAELSAELTELMDRLDQVKIRIDQINEGNICIAVKNAPLLRNMDVPGDIIQIIGEYGRTTYEPCIYCKVDIGFIDCDSDFSKDLCGNHTCEDPNHRNKVRYFFEYGDDHQIQPICMKCAKQWRCKHCGYQAISHLLQDNIKECDSCHQKCCSSCLELCRRCMQVESCGCCPKCYLKHNAKSHTK